MGSAGFNPLATDFDPFFVVDSKTKAQAFLYDHEPYSLNAHGLKAADINHLWNNDRVLCESVLQKIHRIYFDFHTNCYPFIIKLSCETEAWKKYIEIVTLGANEHAALNGSAPAAEIISRIHLSPRGNVHIALKYMKIAEFGKSPHVNYLKGLYQSRGIRCQVKKNYKAAITLLQTDANNGLPHAQYLLGRIQLKNNRQKAITLMEESAKQGYVFAQFHLSILYLQKDTISQNLSKSIQHLLAARTQGYLPALNNLGIRYSQGLGVEKDDLRATSCFLRAANQGFPPAQFNLAHCYKNGIGVLQDPEKAAEWEAKSKDKHFPSFAILMDWNLY